MHSKVEWDWQNSPETWGIHRFWMGFLETVNC